MGGQILGYHILRHSHLIGIWQRIHLLRRIWLYQVIWGNSRKTDLFVC